MEQIAWYASLVKPAWAPPSWLFGPVWTVLYAIITVSFGYVFYQTLLGRLPFWVALPFFLNVIFNIAFTPLQFGLQNNLYASIDVLLVVISLAWALWAIYPYAAWVTYANIPYLAWGIFASVLQITITYLNR
jgi:tryptophan-rich sensory protein